MRRDLQDICAFHADQHISPQAHLRRMCGNLRGVCPGLQEGRQHGPVRRSLRSVCCVLPEDGCLNTWRRRARSVSLCEGLMLSAAANRQCLRRRVCSASSCSCPRANQRRAPGMRPLPSKPGAMLSSHRLPLWASHPELPGRRLVGPASVAVHLVTKSLRRRPSYPLCWSADARWFGMRRSRWFGYDPASDPSLRPCSLYCTVRPARCLRRA
jgi:hypothetical protein